MCCAAGARVCALYPQGPHGAALPGKDDKGLMWMAVHKPGIALAALAAAAGATSDPAAAEALLARMASERRGGGALCVDTHTVHALLQVGMRSRGAKCQAGAKQALLYSYFDKGNCMRMNGVQGRLGLWQQKIPSGRVLVAH